MHIFQKNLSLNEIKKLEIYREINEKGILKNKKKFRKVNFPKISVISALYNRGKFVLRFLRSIQNQFFDDIEIIFVDDCSNDDSATLIQKYQKEDERIILLKNKLNKGTFFSRNLGALKAKGEFLIFPDPDDILSFDILKECYKLAKKNNYEIIRFNMRSEKYFPFNIINETLGEIVYQPRLRTFLIDGYGYEKLVDGIISNKFVERQLFIITLNNIKQFYLKQNMIYFEDGLINFALHLNAKSLYLFRKIGYYYIFNKDSVSRSQNFNLYIKCFFLFIKYVYENTKDNKYEKNMVFFLIVEFIKNDEMLKRITKYSKFCLKIINLLLSDKFITNFYESKLTNMKIQVLNHNEV